MGKPKLYCNEASPFSRNVLLTIKAINFDVEQVNINGMAGETKTPEFLKMNPQHTIPVLEENGKYIVDSHAISVYLVNKYGKSEHQSLAPTTDLYERAVLESRLHFNDSTFISRLIKVLMPLYMGKSKIIDEEACKSVQEAVDFLETFLQNGDYVCGNNLTVADFAIVSTSTLYFALVPLDESKNPKVANWLNQLSKLSYYDDVITKNINVFKATMAEKMKN